jgi:hypothetical protein
MPGTALLRWGRACPPVNDPVTVSLFERARCGYGCAGCLACSPRVVLTPEGAAAFAAFGLSWAGHGHTHDASRRVRIGRHRRTAW